jgi:hypothetical protein
VVNCTFGDLEDLEAVLVEQCQTLRAAPPLIKAHTRFHW